VLSAMMVDITSNSWYEDSGATSHMTNCKEWLDNFTSTERKHVTVANNAILDAQGCGDVLVQGNTGTTTKISNVVHVPGLNANLLSVSKMVSNGLDVTFSKEGCQIYKQGDILATATSVGGMYKLDATRKTERASTAAAGESNTHKLWHQRLGHLNRRDMGLLAKGMVTGMHVTGTSDEQCLPCIEGKHSRTPFKSVGGKRAKEKLELVHSDVCGPMSEPSWGNSRYLVTFTDDFTRKTFGY
jgi:GAG-pre-integrase domain